MNTKPQFPRFPRQGILKAFTLIELLMVVTIVAVLAALLIPTVATVKEKGRQTKCMSNLHQLHIALAMYGNDKGRYPWSYQNGGGDFTKKSNWAYQMNAYLERGTNVFFSAGDASRSPLIVCPSHGKPFSNPVTDGNKLCYGINQQLVGEEFGDSFYPRVYPYDVRAGELILLADACQAGQNNATEMLDGHPQWRQAYNSATAENLIPAYTDSDTDPSADGKVRFRHNGNAYANFLLIDGHIESVHRTQFKEKHLKMNAPIHP